jgi:hypothetical protein
MSRTTTSRKTVRPMTPEAIDAAARADRDAQPLTRSNLKRMKRMKRTPQAKIIRRRPGPDPRGIFSPLSHPSRHSPRLGARPRRPGPTNPSLSKSHCTRTRARRAPVEPKAALSMLGDHAACRPSAAALTVRSKCPSSRPKLYSVFSGAADR